MFALAFVASELVYPLLFPWYYGATVHNAVLFLQTADLGGPYLVGLVLVAANLGVAELILARREHRAPERRLLAIAAVVPALAALYGYVRLRMVDAAAAKAEDVKIGIVQGNLPLMHGGRNALAVHLARTAELRRAGVDLVVWSEGAAGVTNRETPGYSEVRRSIANQLGVPTVIGETIARKEGDHYLYFNSALLSDKEGAIHGRYDKQYLLAFGEYLPLGDTFPVLYEWSPNSGHLSAGNALDPLTYGTHTISALICYEDILPGYVNEMVQHADPDLLVNLTNDTWFGDSTEPWIHLALAKLRAVEHRRYLVRSTNSGVSAIVDPVGRVPMHGSTFKEEALIGVAKFMRGKTGYEILGDWPWRLLAVVTFGMAFVRRERVMKVVGRG